MSRFITSTFVIPLFVLCGCSDGNNASEKSPGGSGKNPTGHKVTVILVLNDFGAWPAEIRCSGKDGYSDIDTGAQVLIKDGTGKTLTVGSLGVGVSSSWDTCRFTALAQVPEADFYSVEVSHRGGLTYSRADMESRGSQVTVSLGEQVAERPKPTPIPPPPTPAPANFGDLFQDGDFQIRLQAPRPFDSRKYYFDNKANVVIAMDVNRAPGSTSDFPLSIVGTASVLLADTSGPHADFVGALCVSCPGQFVSDITTDSAGRLVKADHISRSLYFKVPSGTTITQVLYRGSKTRNVFLVEPPLVVP